MSSRTKNSTTSGLSTLQGLTEADIRLVLQNYTKKHPTYRTSVTREMNIKRITSSQAYNLQLVLYRQKRHFSKEDHPISREEIKSEKYPPPPVKRFSVWELRLPPEKREGNDSKTYDAGTLYISKCPDCNGNGQIKCPCCEGTTRRNCYYCLGNREVSTRMFYTSGEYAGTEKRMCRPCSGSGKATCGCSSDGFITCFRCRGKLFVRHLNVLHVVTKYEIVEHYTDHEDLKQRITTVSGPVVLYRSHKSPDNEIRYPRGCEELKIKSQKFINESRVTETPEEKIVEYRHSIERIPVCRIDFEYRGSDAYFYIYGNENKVYFPDGYPQNCIDCCAIM